ncbi:MAG: hypothetical protein HUU50_09735 [Candidatus Brocadiae bacterium]|nr:hypothetical protein [Candidatus Brocadiia bacterium]
MNSFDELLVLRGALEIEFINSQSLVPYIDTFYKEISAGNTSFSIIQSLLEKQLLTKAQIDFLKEGVEEDKKAKKCPASIEITNRKKVESFLGITPSVQDTENKNSGDSTAKNSQKITIKTDKVNTSQIQQNKSHAKTARNPKINPEKSDTDFTIPPSLQNVFDASELLHTSLENNSPNPLNSKTIELDIRGTSLFKAKPKEAEVQENITEIPEMNVKLSTIDGFIMVRHALNYDFISTQDLRMLLSEHYGMLSKGEIPENLAVLLLKKGYITKPQFSQLQNLMENDTEAKKMASSVDITSRSNVESFIGMLDTKRLLNITCPHCKAKFIARISIKGGKFRCGKCKETFFLNK